jgi:hypothetical protein
LELVEDPPHLNANVSLLVIRVEDADPMKPQLLKHREHQEGVPREPGEIVERRTSNSCLSAARTKAFNPLRSFRAPDAATFV